MVAICGALAVLIAALAAMQYQWSTRVAAADAQREKEHLNASASLFAEKFNQVAREAVAFLQDDALQAIRTNSPIKPIPALFGDVYYADIHGGGLVTAQKWMADGRFAAAALPVWASPLHCSSVAIEEPPAIVAPAEELLGMPADGSKTVRLMRTDIGHCFVATINLETVRTKLFPQLIAASFATAANDYDFSIVWRTDPQKIVAGSIKPADLRTPFFSVLPAELLSPDAGAQATTKNGVFLIDRVETRIVIRGGQRVASLVGPGAWELRIARKGMSLEAAFEQTRRRNLLFSLLVEALLLAAIVFLVVAARRIERLADQKMQFVAGVSHELRTPVSAIAMLSRNQADGLVEGADRVRQYGELIHQQSRRLNAMVEQTLQYAGIRSGLRQPARDTVDLRNLIAKTVEARRADLACSGFEVEIELDDDLPAIQGDAQWLCTAIDNLLSNAQKHGGAGHWMRVSTHFDAAGKEVRIAVEDRGGGIDPAEQPQIFEPFIRGRAAIDAQIPGSGLGLSLVRSAAEAHHGSVTLQSEPGHGCTFTLHLPV